MPFGDRTGPQGFGPRTGRGMGYCSGYSAPGFMNPGPGFGGFGFGRGRGCFGRGFGRGFGWRRFGFTQSVPVMPSEPFYGPTPAQPQAVQPQAHPTKEQEIQLLEEEAKAIGEEQKALNQELDEVKKRIDELKKQK